MKQVKQPEFDKAAVMAQFDRDSAYFVAHEADLLREFPDQWVAVYGERVVGANTDFERLLDDLRKRGVPAEHTYMAQVLTDPPVLIV